jgi:TonB family protein
MFFLTVFLLSAGISKADLLDEMYEGLTKGKEKKAQKQEKMEKPCENNCLGGLGEKAEGRSKEEIMDVVNANMPELNKIYREFLKQKSSLSGKVVLKFTIAASGEIINIKVISSTTRHAKFDKAVKEKVATWKWEAISGGNTTPTIPFNFADEGWDI